MCGQNVEGLELVAHIAKDPPQILENTGRKLIDEKGTVRFEHTPRAAQDALAHRRTEIDALNGGIVRFGAERGVPTPLNEAIVALILGMEHAWSAQPEPVGE